MIYIKVSELPLKVQDILKDLKYFKKDISLEAKSESVLSDYGSDGRRAFVVIFNLDTMKHETIKGSWGGPNIFNPNNSVDLDDKSYAIPENCLLIQGSEGGYGTFANIIVHPKNHLNRRIEEFLFTLSNEEKEALFAFKSVRSGNYRKEFLINHRVKNSTIDSLIDKGLLKKDGRGISITLAGKNQPNDYRSY